jgi:hypothetical protein
MRPSVCVPRTPFGPVARAWSVDGAWIAVRAAAQTILSARPSISVSPTVFHARARESQIAPNLARWTGALRACRASVSRGDPATPRVRIRAATRRAGRDGVGDRAATARCSAPARLSAAASPAAAAGRASGAACVRCSAARRRQRRARGGGGRESAVGRDIRGAGFRPSARRAHAPAAPAPRRVRKFDPAANEHLGRPA